MPLLMQGEWFEKYKYLKINEAESHVLDVGAIDDVGDSYQISLLLVWRVITKRSFTIDAFNFEEDYDPSLGGEGATHNSDDWP